MHIMQKIIKDTSISAVVSGLIAVMISYAGPSLIIFQAAHAAHLNDMQISSWIWAVSLGSGISGTLLSLKYKVPVITAWSTPGAALLLISLPNIQYSDAIGAFIFASLSIILLAATGMFDSLMKKIPKQIAAAMLAGILFKFAIGIFTAMPIEPKLVIPMFLAFIIFRKLSPRYTIPIVLLLGLCIAYVLNLLHFEHFTLNLATPYFTMPTFSVNSILNLGIPLALVTMTGQFVPGIAVMRAAGYNTPVNSMIAYTSLSSLLLAPFGSHGVNLAAITAAICTGKEAHEQPQKRYIAGFVCGLAYIIIGSFGGALVLLFTALPKTMIAAIAGLALLGALMNNLSSAMHDDSEREGALITFIITASGISLLGLGAPFWGLLAGILTRTSLHFKWHDTAK
jgi:benzoate membrane transport protein